MTSISSNGSSNAVLWANVPQNSTWPVHTSYLKALDVTGTSPKTHLLQLDPGSGNPYAYPTVANGFVLIARQTGVEVFSTRPPILPQWTTFSTTNAQATAVGSAWVIGTNTMGSGSCTAGTGDCGIFQATSSGAFAQIPNAGARSISVDLNGVPWIVNNAGQIFKWNGSAFAAFGPSTFVASGVASGSIDTETWAIQKSDQTIFHWLGGTTGWSQITGNPAPKALKIAVFSTLDPTCNTHLPVVLGNNQAIDFFSCATSSFSVSNGAGFDLSTDYAVGTDGNIFHFNAGPATWSPYILIPSGATASNTKIGAWIDGLWAMRTDTGQLSVVVSQFAH